MEGSAPACRQHFLLDLWVEPRELVGAPLLVRGRIRDLRTETQRYVTSYEEMEAFVEAALDAAGIRPRRWDIRP